MPEGLKISRETQREVREKTTDVFVLDENGITQTEREIIDSLTPEQKETVKRLYCPDLVKEATNIIAVRSEDIVFFLECVKKGFLPVESPVDDSLDETPNAVALMGKTGMSHLYTTPNAYADYYREHPGIIDIPEDSATSPRRGFRDSVISDNIILYSSIAIKQAILRNIFPYVNSEAIFKEWFARCDSCLSPSSVWEEFFQELSYLIDVRRHTAKITQQIAERFPLRILKRHTKGTISEAEWKSFLEAVGTRSGILLAFNDELFARYRLDHEAADSEGKEIVFDIPDGKLPFDVILGFEPLGNFEDAVLERLGIE